MTNFSIIVAMDAKRGIGKNGQLPWHLPADLKHFKDVTVKTSQPQKTNAVIMGRKTWESLPERFRPLPSRLNIILTRNKDYPLPSGVIKCAGFDSAMRQISSGDYKKNIENVYVIGGEQVFKEAVEKSECQRIYLTHILQTFDCDAFFPSFSGFQEAVKTVPQADGALTYYFAEYSRKAV